MSNDGRGHILIVHSDRKTQRILHRILGATLYDIDVVDNLQQAEQLAEQRPPSLVVLEYQMAIDPLGQAFAEKATASGTAACLVLVDRDGSDGLSEIFKCRSLTNMLGSPMPLLAEELTATALKLLHKDIFGLEKYMSWGIEPRRIVLSDASQRSAIVEQLSADVRSFGLGPRIASLATLVADELLSNALYNAPVDERGERCRQREERHSPRALSGPDVVTMEYACDARYFAIGVRDGFGSLPRKEILSHLAKCADPAATDKVRFHSAGAGMGLGLVYSCCTHLVFNLEPGSSTEVIGLLDVRFKPAELGRNVASFNVFVQEDGG